MKRTIRIKIGGGLVQSVDDPGAQGILSGLGEVCTTRASHVEPSSLLMRWSFRLIRKCVSDDSRVAGWCRLWPGRWVARMVAGPILGPYPTRAAALAAERVWLRNNRGL